MKTKQQLIAEALEAEFREDEARLDAIVAKAEATDAKAQMDEVSGLKAARERVRGAVRELETNVAADFDASKLAVERGLRELEAGMDRLKYDADQFDEASMRRSRARLAQVEAKFHEWDAHVQRLRTEEAIREHDALATLQERIALSKARAADASAARHDRARQMALEEASQQLEKAYSAAAKRYA
jgi:hypothetical protein